MADSFFGSRFFRIFKRLDLFILAVSVLVGFLAASISAFILFNFDNNIILSQARNMSRYVSNQTFNTMYVIMSRGWSRGEVNTFVSALVKSYKQEKILKVTIFRGPVVNKEFGMEKQPAEDIFVQKSFLIKEMTHGRLNGRIVYAYPLLAKKKCLRCHKLAKIGDVNGVIRVSYNPTPLIKKYQVYFIYPILFIFLIPIIGGIFVTSILRCTIKRNIKSIHEEIENIKSVKDLKKLNTRPMSPNFEEFNLIQSGIGELSSKLSNIALDKEVLEFEIGLLEKFIITSEVVKDWKEHIFTLLQEMNKILKVYNIFSIFIIEETAVEIEVFWKGEPTLRTKEIFDEQMYKSMYISHPGGFIKRSAIESHGVIHNAADRNLKLPELTKEDLSIQTKELFMDSPRIGGIVGIGIQPEEEFDEVRTLVINSVLTTLLNVIGSIKAIYKYTKELEYYATRDGLTGLFNQRMFMEFLHLQFESAKRNNSIFGLLFIDLDNFKLINDIYGHNFGDDFIKGISSTLEGAKREEDILARYGGDEFVMILPDAGKEQSFMVAERIRERVKSFSLVSKLNEMTANITVSIGIAVYPYSASSEKDLFLIADNMMYKAKSEGRDIIHMAFEEDIAGIYEAESRKSKLVLSALDRDIILPYFQPVMDLESGRIVAHELLMRISLNKEDMEGLTGEGVSEGVLQAGEFIEIAENMGIAHKLDLHLLDKALKKVKENNYNGLIFINLSPKSLLMGDYIKTLKRLSIDYGINPQRIIFELTERETVKNINLLEKFISNLKYEGFNFAVDDFGSGFSAFLYIKRFSVDFIKIDGEFIRGILDNKVDRAVVLSSISIARVLGIKVIAEFVESKEILEELKKLKIDYVQGYYIGRPSENFLKND